MKPLILTLLLSGILGSTAMAQKNHFFALHNIIRGDSVYDTFDKQVAFVKSAGFDGIEINQLSSFPGMKAALDKHRFPGAFFYVKVKLEEPHLDPELRDYIRQLRGSRTIISPYIVSESKKYKPSSREADDLAVRLLRQLGDWAGESGLQVAIYPHVNFYVERTDHALTLAKAAGLKNVGMSFNLCHWLATSAPSERQQLKAHLSEIRPHLKMVTICGANDTVSQQKNIWEDYILPLGSGSFDTYGLVKYLVRDLGYKDPIGVQCYNIRGDKPALVHRTISVWKDYQARLAAGK